MTRAHRRPTLLLCGLAAATIGACGGESGGGSPDVSRETFVATYVDLRVAALHTEEGRLEDTARARVLSEHGVTEEGLLAFVEERGTDLGFMRDLWNEIEARLDSIPPLDLDGAP